MSENIVLDAKLEATLQSIVKDGNVRDLRIAAYRNKKSTSIKRHQLKRNLIFKVKRNRS